MAKRKVIVLTILAVAAVGFLLVFQRARHPSEGQGSEAVAPPNVVLLIIDTLRADLLGCYGCPEDISPEIDEIAQNGVVFEDVISQCSWTRPSIASMVTGLYPRTLGIYKEQYDVLVDEHLTLAEILRERGYRTLGITANPNINKTFGFHQGFDEYSESTVIWSWMQPESGKVSQKEGKFADLPRSQEVFDWVLSRASSADGRPTYVQINIMEVHSPDLAREEFWPLVAFYAERDAQRADWRGPRKDIVWKTYMAVRQVSHDTGVFVRKLRGLQGWENTLFVITSDHGQGLDDHPDVYDSLHHGNLLYGSQVFVPLIFYNPADPAHIPRGRRVGTRARLMDMMSTILAYIGQPIPDHVMGESLMPLMAGDGRAPALPGVFVTETNWRNVDKIAAYGEEWKYIENRDGWEGVNGHELQAMDAIENGRMTDQIHTHPEDSERLRLALMQWESRFQRSESVSPVVPPSEDEVKQLKSLGYIK